MSPEDVRVFLLAAEIASSSLEGTYASREDFPDRLRVVAEVLRELATNRLPEPAYTPAVPTEQSAFPDYLLCLNCGRRVVMLKGHIRIAHDLKPSQYRSLWDLPSDYPMVAPFYSKRRTEIAKRQGFGLARRRGRAAGRGAHHARPDPA